MKTEVFYASALPFNVSESSESAEMRELAELVDEAETLAIQLGCDPEERSNTMSKQTEFRSAFERSHPGVKETFQAGAELDLMAKDIMAERCGALSYSEALAQARQENPALAAAAFPEKKIA